MKKKFLAALFVVIMALQLMACSLRPTCKESGCDETEIYKDGYCNYHYFVHASEDVLKDIVNMFK